jgi:hypothetical protein
MASNQILRGLFNSILIGACVVCSNGFVIKRINSSPRITTSSLNMATDVSSRQMVFQGTELFRQGDVKGSIQKFDNSVPPGSNAYLWQRGISYYYADEFGKGSQQFRDDVLRSPLDVEEIVWDIACLLRMDPTTFPPPTMMSLPPGKKDRRLIMVRPKQYLFRKHRELECRTTSPARFKTQVS